MQIDKTKIYSYDKYLESAQKLNAMGRKLNAMESKGPLTWEQKNHSHGNIRIIPMGAKNPYRRSERLIS